MSMHLEVEKVGEGYAVEVVGGDHPKKFDFATGGELSAFMKGWSPDDDIEKLKALKEECSIDLYKELTDDVRHALCEFNDPKQTAEYCVAQMWIANQRLKKRLSDALEELGKSGATPFGLCPTCNGVGVEREKRPNGNDTCFDGHTYPSADAV